MSINELDMTSCGHETCEETAKKVAAFIERAVKPPPIVKKIVRVPFFKNIIIQVLDKRYL